MPINNNRKIQFIIAGPRDDSAMLFNRPFANNNRANEMNEIPMKVKVNLKLGVGIFIHFSGLGLISLS